MSLSALAGGTARALRETLNTDREIEIETAFPREVDGVTCDNFLVAEAPLTLCSATGREESVRVMCFLCPDRIQRPNGDWETSEDRLWASVTWERTRTPFCWILVGAVAIAIARWTSAAIEDGSAFYTTECDGIGPDALVTALTVSEPNLDLDRAAERVYQSMNKSVQVTEWLRTRQID